MSESKSPLEGKKLLYIGNRLFVTHANDLTKCMWSSLKKQGLSALYMVLQSNTGDQVWVKRLAQMGIVDEFTCDKVLEGWELRGEADVARDVIKWLESNNLKVDSCLCMSQLMRLVQAEVCSQLGLVCDSLHSLKTTVSKIQIQDTLCKLLPKHGISSFSVADEQDLRHALQQMSLPVIMKPSYGGGSSGCKLLHTENECQRHLSDIRRDMTNGGDTCQKIVYSQEVVVMPFIKGNKYAVDVAICRGRLIGSVIAERGPPPLPYFYATTLAMPGNLCTDQQQELIEVAFNCCRAVGLHNGVYDVDLVWEKDGFPRLLEINPRPGGHAIKDLAARVYGVNIFVLNAILACSPDDSYTELLKNHFKQTCFGFAMLPYLSRNGEQLKRSVAKMFELQPSHGVELAYPGKMSLEDFIKSCTKYEYPPVVICAYGDTLTHARKTLSNFLTETCYFENKIKITF